MSAEKKVPAIRFKGFSREWEENDIGNILTEMRRPIELKDGELYQLVTVKRRNGGVVPRALLKGSDILVKTYFVLNAGDFLISKRQVVHGANGIVPKSLDNAVVSNEYLVVTNNENITTNFWTVISNRTEMHKIFFISSYGVDIEKLVFDVTDWKNRTIVIPKVTEQNRITDYFQQLDTLIAQHQQKHDKLLNLKKSLLEKMFPKQGATVPEIRFKGFSGEWTSSELGKLLDITSAARVHKNEWADAGVPFFRTSDVVSIYKGQENKKAYISLELYKELSARSGAVKKDDLLITGGGSIGIPYLITTSDPMYFKDADLLWLKNTTGTNGYLLFTFFSSPPFRNYINSIAHIGTISHYTIEQAKTTPILVPEESEEQTKIGNLFKQLDTLINQHQAQLKKLNNIKQACLEKMFV